MDGAPAVPVDANSGRDAPIALALDEPSPSAATGPSLLGKREAEVATLVAQGLGNKHIAARLLISEHTVDSHIRNIMRKLGVGSRAQIAAWTASAEIA